MHWASRAIPFRSSSCPKYSVASQISTAKYSLHRRQLWPYACHFRTFPSFASISFNIELSMSALQVSRHHRSSAFQSDVSFPNIWLPHLESEKDSRFSRYWSVNTPGRRHRWGWICIRFILLLLFLYLTYKRTLYCIHVYFFRLHCLFMQQMYEGLVNIS